MTSTERQGIADAFRACLPHLWCGSVYPVEASKTQFICHALEMAGHKYAGGAVRVTRYRLCGHGSLRCWLMGQGFCWSDFTDARLQAHRKAWVEQLIAEFSV